MQTRNPSVKKSRGTVKLSVNIDKAFYLELLGESEKMKRPIWGQLELILEQRYRQQRAEKLQPMLDQICEKIEGGKI